MEEYYFLMDIVGDLVEKGYSVNFSGFEETFKNLNHNKNTELLPEDFKIDGIYKCKESVLDSYFIFVFAVSSRQYKFKGIVVNAFEEEHDDTSFWNKLRNYLTKLADNLLRKPGKAENS